MNVFEFFLNCLFDLQKLGAVPGDDCNWLTLLDCIKGFLLIGRFSKQWQSSTRSSQFYINLQLFSRKVLRERAVTVRLSIRRLSSSKLDRLVTNVVSSLSIQAQIVVDDRQRKWLRYYRALKANTESNRYLIPFELGFTNIQHE